MHIENLQKNKIVFFGKLDKNWEIDGSAKSSKDDCFHDILQFQKWSKWKVTKVLSNQRLRFHLERLRE
jgi:hypothetical protein